MSKIYVDEILPKDNAKITAADLQLPAGSVVQTKSFDTTSASGNFSTTAYVNTPLVLSITPTSASNKILIIAHGNMYHNNGQRDVMISLFRDGTTQLSPGAYGQTMMYNATAAGLCVPFTITKLDSPNTTNSVEYRVKARLDSAAGNGNININGSQATITLMEIAQ
jgi:hypothetical protein